ncbi:lef4 [Artaxa digramma nucleopolyhedrovirus]|uniref:Lef4 n=1 Tax=Artaxa digramma nucleopolyhedrovirus TaxID=3070910 RepID=A0AAE6R6M8_9ABAC|nr:lef4 [Euproctis digramma nucleopolyhedrovirus]QHB21740.1 lef4 [Artaxa digramma nucleopolyhedrovirus]
MTSVFSLSSFIEKEISYSINLSQDLLYIILSSYIFKKFIQTQEYIDCVDENDVRSRMITGGDFKSTVKTPQTLRKFVHAHDNVLVPLVDRTSVEKFVDRRQVSPVLKKISTCQVWGSSDWPEIEIKYEKVYLDKSVGDSFDSLMVSKQVTLLNLLQNKQEKITKNSYLGSDEILVYLRLEYEYEGETPEVRVLDYLADLVAEIDALSHHQNISPLLPYTTLHNNTIYRKFQDEKLVYSNMTMSASVAVVGDQVDDICRWAHKLDGVRGKGLIVRNFIIIFMDDMQMFSGHFPWLFSINNVVAFQCELIDQLSTVYITDLMHVFKYTYNNRTQYECSLDGYDIDPLSAIECLNYLGETNSVGIWLNGGDGNNRSTTIATDTNNYNKTNAVQIKFQKFMKAPIKVDGYSSVPVDGFVVLDNNFKYVKYKYVKTLELEYNAKEHVFYDLTGPVYNYQIVNANDVSLAHNKIYEVFVDNTNNSINVLKVRSDRIIPQLFITN